MGGFADREKKRSDRDVVSAMFTETPDDGQAAPEAPAAFPKEATPTKGRPKSKGENKVIKSLSVLPSLYEDAQKVAFVERTNLSELISGFLQEYVGLNSDKLEEYNKIKKCK